MYSKKKSGNKGTTLIVSADYIFIPVIGLSPFLKIYSLLNEKVPNAPFTDLAAFSIRSLHKSQFPETVNISCCTICVS